jgi:hypothetical protein
MPGINYAWGKKGKCIHSFSRKSEGKWSLGRLRRRYEDNIKIALKEIHWMYVGCIHLAQNRDQ